MKANWSFPKWSAIFLLLCTCAAAQTSTPPPRAGRTLVWSDEFNAPNGSPVDSSKWVLESGGNGWGNQELEYYTARPQNAFQQDGNLVIKVLRREIHRTRWRDSQLHFGSSQDARQVLAEIWTLRSSHQDSLTARASGPRSGCSATTSRKRDGPTAARSTSWRTSAKSRPWFTARFTAPATAATKASALPSSSPTGQRFADDFHVYAVEWEPKAIRFYVDDHLYATRTPADLPHGAKWVYNHPFFILLNVAVGGGWPGNPDATTVFPQTMLVDYVRVYR